MYAYMYIVYMYKYVYTCTHTHTNTHLLSFSASLSRTHTHTHTQTHISPVPSTTASLAQSFPGRSGSASLSAEVGSSSVLAGRICQKSARYWIYSIQPLQRYFLFFEKF